MFNFSTLTEAVAHWSLVAGDAPALTLLSGDDQQTMTYRELYERALSIGGNLRRLCNPGARVILGFGQGTDYVSAFLGCAYAGVVAVTSSPPDELRRSKRLQALIADSGAEVILTNDIAMQHLKDIGLAAGMTFLNTDAMTDERLQSPTPPDAGALMFLQYTSGSTSVPRGVVLTHGSITANLQAINADTKPHADSVYVSWLPLYHDMGLIFMTLAPLYAGRPVYLMSPAEFLRYPDRWLRAMSNYRGTITAAPNFAYRHCVERIPMELAETLDLSQAEYFINGSEPVRVEDMEAFYRRFSPSGLRKTAIAGGYGMSEVGVYVSCGEMLTGHLAFDRAALENEGRVLPLPDRGDAARLLAPCGKVNAEHFDLCIVDPETLLKCESDRVGEIWIAAPSNGKGYWRNREATSETFNGRLADDPRAFLRTGDLGFVYRGDLYICGRIKEMMILHGRNVFPADLCTIVEEIGPAMRGRRAGAFALEGEAGDEAVIVCAARVSEDTWQQLAKQIIAALSSEMGVIPGDVVFVQNRALKRTTSGKIQHKALRQAYLNGSLEIDFSLRRAAIPRGTERLAPVTETDQASEVFACDTRLILAPDWMVQRICHYCATICECEAPEPDRSLFELGLDSLRGARLIEAIETDLLGRASPVTLSAIADLKTPRAIAAALVSSMTPRTSTPVKELVL